MDSELSLIEISGADDSLLLQPIPIPSDDGDTGDVSLDKNYFPCSPFQLLDGSAPSVPSGVVDKENIGVNKFETPSLGVDSRQRKRKNKRCGYNLRKSLAWNRAFLTEEGVLDPTELSIISGNASDVMCDKLAVIHEDDKELSHENSVSHSGSENLPAFEDELFQKLPRIVENEGQSTSRSSTKTRLTTAKPTRIPVSSVKRRVLAAQDVNSSRLKQSSGQFVTASSSLKRAASSTTTNVGCKDLKKISKARTSNPDLGLHSSTVNTVPSSGYSKQTQRVKPDIPIGRNVRMKGLSGNAAGPQRNVTGSTPAGKPLTAKSTTRQASGNMANPQSRTDTMPVKNMWKPPIKSSSRNEVGSASKGVSLVEKAELIEGKIQHLQVQRAEPTGLRMPSPSISFFDQPRDSALRRPIINAQSYNALPPVSSNMKAPQRIGSADTTILAPVQKMMLTPDIKSEGNAKRIHSNAKTSVGLNPIPRQREDSDDACYNLKSFLQLDVKELSIHPKFSCLQKEACKNLREDINQIVCDGHLKDGNATKRNNTTGSIGTVTDAQAREECPDDDRGVHQSKNNSSLGDCNQTGENQCPERYDRTTGGLSSPCGRTDVVIPAHLCGCEDDGLVGLQKTGGRLDSEDDVNGSSSSSLKVEIGMASLAGNHCLIIADDSMEQLKDSSSNSEQPFNMTSSRDDLLERSTGHEIPSEPAPASTVGDVSGGPNSFSVPSHITSDKPGSLDSPQLEEDERATSHSMASGDAAANEKGKDKINLLKAGDILDSTTIHEEPIDVSAYHIGTPQSIAEPALSKEGAEDHQLTLTACCFVASLLQSIDGSINSNQIDLPVQVDSSHLVGVHLDSSDMINAGLYVESQLEQAFHGLDTSTPADGNVAVATNICVETESETKIDMLDSATIDDNLSCEKSSLNSPDRVSVEYEALDYSHWLENQQTSSPNAMLPEKAANEENPVETELNEEKKSSSLVSNMEMNDEHILVALGVPSHQAPEIGSASHGSEDRVKIPVAVSHLVQSMREAEETDDELAKHLSVDAPLQPLIGRTSYNQSRSPVREESCRDNLSDLSIIGDKIIPVAVSHLVQSMREAEDTDDELAKHLSVDVPLQPLVGCTSCNQSRSPVREESCFDNLADPSIGSDKIIPVAVSHLVQSMREAEDADDELAKHLSVDAPLQPLVGRTSYNQSKSPVREESCRDNLADPSTGSDRIIVGSNLKSQTSAPEDVEACISFASNIFQLETESGIKTGEANDSTMPTDDVDKDQKLDHVVGKPPADVIPYSDEWLAAIEAAGEDILKMKGGAVQNSPPERSEPEPGPWSPVRRKNNQAIGPFDCTKFINAGVPPSSP